MDSIVKRIAKMITEDPDVFIAEAMGPNDTGQITDIKSEISQTEKDSDKLLQKQQSQQKKMEDAARQARNKVLKPQLDQLDKNVTSLSSDMQKGSQDTDQNAKNMEQMNKNMLEIQSLLGSVSKTALE